GREGAEWCRGAGDARRDIAGEVEDEPDRKLVRQLELGAEGRRPSLEGLRREGAWRFVHEVASLPARDRASSRSRQVSLARTVSAAAGTCWSVIPPSSARMGASRATSVWAAAARRRASMR